MINHSRTLLVNVDGVPSGFANDPGEEFILPTFNAIELPGFLITVRDQLFGSAPDKIMLNYRARQYMGLLGVTELQEFVTDLDSRITYDILPRDQLFDSLFVTTVTKLDATTANLFLIDEVGPPDQAGRTRHSWRIDVLTSSTVSVNRQTPVAQVSIQNYTLTEGLSSLIQLVGSGLQARFESGIGSEWFVQAVSRPTQDIGTIVANLGVIGDDKLLALFGVGDPKGSAEPFLTFRRLWEDHPDLPYRLGGVLLAWIYQADDIFEAST